MVENGFSTGQSDGVRGVSSWPIEICLISELADELAALPEDELRRAEVVLPTKRLGNWLLALVAARKGAFIPPRLYNFDAFVSAHGTTPADPREGWSVAGDLELELLLAGLLKEDTFRHLRLGHEHEIKQLFAEFSEWSLEDSAFDALRDCLRQDVIRSELALDTLTERVDELERLFRATVARLTSLESETSTARSARRSDSLAAALENSSITFAGRVYIVGFTSIGGLHKRLLAALAKEAQVSIWVSAPPALYGERNPLGLLLEALAAPVTLRAPTRSQLAPGAPLADRITVHAAPTVLDEVAEALRLAEAAVAGGCPASLVAILVTSDTTYGKPLRTLLRGKGIEANLAIGTPLASTALGGWIRAFLDTATQRTAGALLALASHPMTFAWHAAMQDEDDTAVSTLRLREDLARDLCTGVTFEGAAEGRGLSLRTRPYVAALFELLSPFSQVGPRRAERRQLAAWAKAFASLLATVGRATAAAQGVTAAGDDADVGVTKSAVEASVSFCAALERAAAFTAAPLAPGEFLAIVRDKLLGLDVRSVGDQLRGIQVLSVAEARYVPFALTIILGCAEGSFPRALPKDHLVDNFLKSRIGLPGWQLLEAIEDTTFHLLRARLPRMALLHAKRQGTEPVVRSRFVEGLLSAGAAREIPVAPGGVALLSYLHKTTTVEGARLLRVGGERLTAIGAYGGQRQALSETMSATALEQLVRCPYRFLLSRLGVRDTTLPDTPDVRTEGDFLHEVLEAFFTGGSPDEPLAEPLQTVGTDAEFRAYALERLAMLTIRLAPATLIDSPLLLQLELRSWPRFVDHLLKIYGESSRGRMAQGFREMAFGDDAEYGAALKVGAQTVRIHGSIDSLDVLDDDLHVITDYKRGSPPDRGQVKAGLAPQLLLYAKALDELETQREGGPAPRLALANAVVGYWNILRGEWTLAAAGTEALDRSKRLGLARPSEKLDLGELVGGLMERWTERSRALFGAEAAAFTPDAAHCGFCRFAGICRREETSLA